MTNHDHYRLLTKDLDAPDSFLEYAFYFAVSAALERRVFYGDESGRPLYLNQYMLLVAPAGIGKGLAMREAKRLLTGFSLKNDKGEDIIDPVTRQPRPLFYQLPDATTFEHLAYELANCYKLYTNAAGDMESSTPAYLALEELSSLVKTKKNEDVPRFLLNLYDSDQPFRYRTRGGTQACIERGCMNLIAGTTMTFLRTAEEQGLIGEGLMSRFLVIHENERRSTTFHIANLTAAQKESQTHLRKWLYVIGRLVGQIIETPTTHEWLEAWWREEADHLARYQDDKLAGFFSRRKVHLIKLAAAIHFSESLELEITTKAFEAAAAKLRALETAIVMIAKRTGRNSTFPIQERLVDWLRKSPRRSFNEVVSFLMPDLRADEIQSTLQLSTQSRQIGTTEDGLYCAYDANGQLITQSILTQRTIDGTSITI